MQRRLIYLPKRLGIQTTWRRTDACEEELAEESIAAAEEKEEDDDDEGFAFAYSNRACPRQVSLSLIPPRQE